MGQTLLYERLFFRLSFFPKSLAAAWILWRFYGLVLATVLDIPHVHRSLSGGSGHDGRSRHVPTIYSR